ncbi:Fumarate hydratase [Desulfurobacterium thermolithotrophum DSM 11699]|uniref:Fumarate hydratase n=1 Tax=Desulfurobacterium thermolithotrophum (strain DSM 11699 / BSA) TaxID=868864 RepID=F0S0Z6_DESTD|nr:aspartate ammonia-lyase [Desulfurobacterium thermolithotrophum]ADY72800.1 Fumarate hydratase [Desulfurobacterium thermolithotrophum DSM 11699]
MFREEKDFLGSLKIPADSYYGIHTARALKNFPLSGYKVPKELITAYALVKKACAIANTRLGYIEEKIGNAIIKACDEILEGKFQEEFIVDALQGGAGTSTNMNINEVIANRANEILGYKKGQYYPVHPLEHVNLHQSTNDTYPTALKIAALFMLEDLSEAIARLQGVLQEKEKEFAFILKIGRTELQEAVPLTLGREFSGFAEAISRDRWRVWKCKERIRVLNIGGTAIGTGLTAPRDYVFFVIEVLRELTGLNISRAENPVGVTAFADDMVEVVGILDAYASNLFKISNDLRLMNLLKEVRLKPVQPGSSIMPGKVNPVVLEATMQVALKVKANSYIVRECASSSTFQIVEFMPLIAFSFLESLRLLLNVTTVLKEHLTKLKADKEFCKKYFEESFSIITALLPLIGYEKAVEIVQEMKTKEVKNIKEFLQQKFGNKILKLLSPESLNSLGYDEYELEELRNDNNS